MTNPEIGTTIFVIGISVIANLVFVGSLVLLPVAGYKLVRAAQESGLEIFNLNEVNNAARGVRKYLEFLPPGGL